MSVRWMWLSLLAALVVASAIAVAVPWLRAGGIGGPDATARPSTSMVAFHCSGDVCDRIADDLVGRTPLTDADRTYGQRVALVIAQTLPRETELDCFPAADACLARYLPADTERVRDALTAAGYPDATVQIATTDDPAPGGAVMFAVPVGPACLLGYHAAGTGPGDVLVAGQLPDGSCLR